MHNITDLINSGVAFTILDEDTDFGEDGELTGYATIIDELYEPSEYEPENDGICDINELRDDDDRWGHIRDAHIAQRVAECIEPRGGGRADTWGEMQYFALERERRVRRLVHYINQCQRRLGKAQRRGDRAGVEAQQRKLRVLRNGIDQRYRASVALIVRRARSEWWLLYLTKQQRAALHARVK